MKESTWLMAKKHGWRVDRFIHNYLYFLFYYPYVWVMHKMVLSLKYLTWCKPLVPIGKMVFNRYHAKVLSRDDTCKIFVLKEDVRVDLDGNKRIIPYKYATRILFQEPDFIVVMDCPCKKSTGADPADINSCIAVGRGVASFWLEHCKKYNPRKINQAEALRIIDRLRKKQHITQAFLKVATGGSTGVICNCHPDTCVSLQATRLAGNIDKSLSMTAGSGYSVRHDDARCTRCGVCAAICQFGAIRFDHEKRCYDRERCLGCGLCVENCGQEAMSLYVDQDKLLPLDLDAIQMEKDQRIYRSEKDKIA
ncbi:MAG: 4Fe-4S binding protein [Desulfobacteraceae bacterium]|nr:4Fe-4S binding protein [Desulfobacteraceae bacterium]